MKTIFSCLEDVEREIITLKTRKPTKEVSDRINHLTRLMDKHKGKKS